MRVIFAKGGSEISSLTQAVLDSRRRSPLLGWAVGVNYYETGEPPDAEDHLREPACARACARRDCGRWQGRPGEALDLQSECGRRRCPVDEGRPVAAEERTDECRA